MAAKKPTKQQIAQAKARAGGNTTSKTTPARMAKGAKDIALFAATIAGPGKVAKVATTAAKAAKATKVASVAQKAAYKAKVTTPAKKVVAAAKEESFKVKSNIHPNLHHKVSKDVSIKPSSAMKKENALFGKTSGAIQASKQNARLTKPISKAEAKANARGLKAANKPTNKVGSKADKKLRSETNSVQLSKEDTKALYDYYYGKGSGDDITQINKRVTPKNEARSVRNFKKKSK